MYDWKRFADPEFCKQFMARSEFYIPYANLRAFTNTHVSKEIAIPKSDENKVLITLDFAITINEVTTKARIELEGNRGRQTSKLYADPDVVHFQIGNIVINGAHPSVVSPKDGAVMHMKHYLMALEEGLCKCGGLFACFCGMEMVAASTLS